MINRKEGNRHVLHGDSLHDVSLFLKTHFPTWSVKTSRNNDASPKWDLNAGYDGAWKLANEGWSQGAADLAVAISAIEPDATMPEIKFDMGGEYVDVPRYLGGNPACMATHGRTTKQKPIVHLVVNGVVSASVGAKSVAAYGAALTAVVDQLENSGRRVEVDVTFAVQINGTRVCVGWNVKRAEDHLDLAAIAFSIQHPAALRRIGFAMIERSTARETSSYGMPDKLAKDDLPMLGIEDDAFILPGVGLSFGGVSASEAIPLAIRQVNEAAGEEILSAT